MLKLETYVHRDDEELAKLQKKLGTMPYSNLVAVISLKNDLIAYGIESDETKALLRAIEVDQEIKRRWQKKDYKKCDKEEIGDITKHIARLSIPYKFRKQPKMALLRQHRKILNEMSLEMSFEDLAKFASKLCNCKISKSTIYNFLKWKKNE
jgi:hypothetical protein